MEGDDHFIYIYNSMGLFDVAFLVASGQTPMVVVLAVAKLVAAVVCGGPLESPCSTCRSVGTSVTPGWAEGNST